MMIFQKIFRSPQKKKNINNKSKINSKFFCPLIFSPNFSKNFRTLYSDLIFGNLYLQLLYFWRVTNISTD